MVLSKKTWKPKKTLWLLIMLPEDKINRITSYNNSPRSPGEKFVTLLPLLYQVHYHPLSFCPLTQQSHTWEGKKTMDGNGLDKAKETQTFWPHLQNGRQKTHQDRDARNGERQQATRKTGKEVVRRHCRLVHVDAHFQRQFSWQTTDNRGEESLASTAHMGHELMMIMMRGMTNCPVLSSGRHTNWAIDDRAIKCRVRVRVMISVS